MWLIKVSFLLEPDKGSCGADEEDGVVAEAGQVAGEAEVGRNEGKNGGMAE